MKKAFLLIVVSALLVTMGFAQTPAAGSNTDQATIKGCLGGSDGNYTVAEDGTNQILKITTSSVDLKLHLGQDVSLSGNKTSGSASSGAADNSFAVTGLSMISEHCAAGAAAPAATAAAPATTVSPVPETIVIAPAAVGAASIPAATASPSSTTVSTPAVDAAAPAATVSPSSATTVRTTVVDAPVPTRRSAHARKLSATHTADVATVSPSSETVIAPEAKATTPAATTASPDTVSTPAAAATTPTTTSTTTPTVTHKGGSLWLLILVGVLVIALAAVTPFVVRWRKRKMLERTDAPNLSLTHEASPDQDKPEERKVA
jgi:hypothetical protein